MLTLRSCTPEGPLYRLTLFAAGLITAAVVAVGATLWALRGDMINAAQRDTNNIAAIFANQINRSIREIDVLLNGFSERATEEEIVTPHDFQQKFASADLLEMMHEQLALLHQIDVITVIDASGQAVNSTRRAARGLDFSYRDYFQYLRDHDRKETYVSVPVVGRVVGDRRIFFTKRIDGRFGDFVGVVTVGVPITYFQRSYDSIGSLAGQGLLLLRRDGTVLVRYPENKYGAGVSMPRRSSWYDVVAHGGGFYTSPGYFRGDGPLLVAVHPLPDYPLVANVSMPESAALATWKWRATLIAAGTVVAALCSMLLLRALLKQFWRLQHSQASLVESARKLECVNLRLDVALNNMSQGLCVFDEHQRLLMWNARFLAMYGLPQDALKTNCTLVDALSARASVGMFSGDPAQFAATLKAQIAAGKSNRFTIELSDGRVIAISNEPTPTGGWVTTHEDVTERFRSQERIAHMARHDALTDLPNRVLIREKMDEAVSQLKRTGKGFSLFIFDLDLFKAVNDTLGHPVGDGLLKEVARRLQSCAEAGQFVGRLGGDEFAILQVTDAGQKQAAIVLAERVQQTVSRPYEIDGNPIVIGISMGIALAPKDGAEVSQLLKNADLALYRAKSEGRDCYRFFESEMDEEARLKRSLEIDLRSALAREEFEIHYQLILDIASRQPCGAEALVRWRHPQYGLIGPDRFIPLAEEIGLIIPLGEWILRHACCEAAKWPVHIHLAVNLSPVQFRSPSLVETVSEVLAGSGFPAHRLELEITESVLLQKHAGNIGTLDRLNTLGVGIVLDDFGTGYSSLRYLSMYKFSKIKIDKSFVSEMPRRADCGAIVCAVASLARNLDIGTTAEGVETWEQFELLRAAGCTQAQGFLFSRPQPVAQLIFDVAPERQVRNTGEVA